jgi:hypothetical protein
MVYAKKLKEYTDAAQEDLLILMRVYFEKWAAEMTAYAPCSLADSMWSLASGLDLERP